MDARLKSSSYIINTKNASGNRDTKMQVVIGTLN